jgi:hypothetical protein
MKRRIIIAALLATVTARADMEWETAIGQKDQVTKGLVSYWAMRNSGTTVYDEYGANNGTAQGGVTFATTHAAVGYGASFDGTNDYISIAHTGGFTDFSASLWIKAAAAGAKYIGLKYDFGSTNRSVGITTGIAAATAKLRVIMSDNGTLNAGNAKDYITTEDLLTDTWLHFALTFVGASSTLTLYANGAALSPTKTVDAAITTIHSSATPITIGSALNAGAGSNFLRGLIDEVRIYNRALTADEIKQLYRMGAIPKGIK